MKRSRLLSLVGITSIALAQAGLAAPHGGGGGGGFSGGGHVGGLGGAPHFGGGTGGFHAPGPAFSGPSVGVGTRGGGVGFGMGRYSPYQSAPSSSVRSIAGRSANSPAHVNTPAGVSSPRQVVSGNRTGNTSTHATAGVNRPDNRNGALSDRRGQTSRPTTPRPSNESAFSRDHHIFARENGAQHRDWDRRHAHFFNGHWFCWDGAFWIGLDDGYYPWDFYPYYAYDYYPYDYYADVEPNNQDYAQQADPNVSAVQSELAQLGYYNGPIDGLFGADTRTALTRYQIDNHLQVTGSLTSETMQSLGLPGLASN
jgi:Putative peptidoglycan binding domain